MRNESIEFLCDLFEYDTSSPSCLRWKKRLPHSRNEAQSPITYKGGNGYYATKIKGAYYPCHRIILILHGYMPLPGQVADHINKNREDNRIENLRWLTLSQNCSNRTVTAKSGYKYVRIAPSGRFRAQYRCLLTKRSITCGTYDSPHQAHMVAISHRLENCWRLQELEGEND